MAIGTAGSGRERTSCDHLGGPPSRAAGWYNHPFGLSPVQPVGRDGARLDRGARRPRPQPQKHRRRAASRQARRDYGPLRLRQVVARLRHHLRGRTAPLRRITLLLRPPVPRADGEARRRPDRRAFAGDRHRAEDHRLQSAIDRGHGHRNLRLSAAAVCKHRHSALPCLRPRDRLAVPRADHRHRDAVAQRGAGERARAGGAGPQGRVQEELVALRRAASPRSGSTGSCARSTRTSSSTAGRTTPSTSSSTA